MERRFRCTACGKCCFGWIPLTLAEMHEHAGRFPLAMVWRIVPRTVRAYALTERLGIAVRLPKRLHGAASIALTAYIPPGLACPELTPDGHCAIHAHKPLRCRAMPFYAAREESDQADLLRPRKGWDCDTSDAAPVVYRDGRILERGDFDGERRALLDQVAAIRVYANYAFRYMPWVSEQLAAMMTNREGSLVTSLSSFLVACRQYDARAIAARQLAVLERFASATEASLQPAEYQEYHRNYRGWAKEMAHLAQAPRAAGAAGM